MKWLRYWISRILARIVPAWGCHEVGWLDNPCRPKVTWATPLVHLSRKVYEYLNRE